MDVQVHDVSAPTLERLYCPLVEEVGKPGTDYYSGIAISRG